MILMDCGCTVHGYQSDISRTWVFGRPSPRQRKVWNTVKRGQEIALEAAKLGVPVGSIDDAVRRYYEGEGWGLTTDGTSLIMSDGSPTITWRDPRTFSAEKTITVIGGGGPVPNINELEWVDGFLLANVWETNAIVRIDPANGRILQTIDLAFLPEPRRGATDDDVLNGIAWDAAGHRLFVTGKRWSHIFEIPKPW